MFAHKVGNWMPLECRVIAYLAGPVPAILDWYGHTG